MVNQALFLVGCSVSAHKVPWVREVVVLLLQPGFPLAVPRVLSEEDMGKFKVPTA